MAKHCGQILACLHQACLVLTFSVSMSLTETGRAATPDLNHIQLLTRLRLRNSFLLVRPRPVLA